MNLELWLKKSADQMSLYASTGSGPEKRAISAWCKDVRSAAEIAHEQDDLLREWLRFAADVQPDCAAGIDWLNKLREKSKWMMESVEQRMPAQNEGSHE